MKSGRFRIRVQQFLGDCVLGFCSSKRSVESEDWDVSLAESEANATLGFFKLHDHKLGMAPISRASANMQRP